MIQFDRGLMMKSVKMLPVMSALICILVVQGQAIEVQLSRSSVNSGGGEMSGAAFRLSSSIGQAVAGFEAGKEFLHWVGFWSGELPEPAVVNSVQEAKRYSDGTFISVGGKIATSGETDFDGFFYLEESDRSSGIRISVPSWPISGLSEGSVVNVIGTLSTTFSRERQIIASVIIITSTVSPIKPLGMINSLVGGGNYGELPNGQCGVTGGTGLNNVGLLVKTWGWVIESGSGYVVIDDGSGAGIRVKTSGLVKQPTAGDFISVTGISSLHNSGVDKLRMVLPRRDTDLLSH